jgi:hypothetical protein
VLPNSGSGGAYEASEVVWSVAVRELRPCHVALWQGKRTSSSIRSNLVGAGQ